MHGRQQRGTTTVEFAIVGAVVITLLFAIVEFGRIIFTLNVLEEGVRRAARVAAVCDVGNARDRQGGRVRDAAGSLHVERRLTEYLDQNGVPLGDPSGGDYASIRYVRVRIVDYSFAIAIPFIAPVLARRPSSRRHCLARVSGVPKFGAAPAC